MFHVAIHIKHRGPGTRVQAGWKVYSLGEATTEVRYEGFVVQDRHVHSIRDIFPDVRLLNGVEVTEREYADAAKRPLPAHLIRALAGDRYVAEYEAGANAAGYTEGSAGMTERGLDIVLPSPVTAYPKARDAHWDD